MEGVEKLRNNVYIDFELNKLPLYSLEDYIGILSCTHFKEEVTEMFNNSFEDLKSMVLGLEYNYIMQCDEQTLKDVYNL